MANWEDVAVKALDFLSKPTIAGCVLVVCFFLLTLAMVPAGMVAFVSWDNTNRLEQAIVKLSNSCRFTAALPPSKG